MLPNPDNSSAYDTDVAKVGPQLGYSIMLQHPALLKQLANVYKLTKRMEERARKTASNTMVEYVQKLGQESQQVATPTVPPPQAPAEIGTQDSPKGNGGQSSP